MPLSAVVPPQRVSPSSLCHADCVTPFLQGTVGGAWDSIDSDRILAIKVSFFPSVFFVLWCVFVIFFCCSMPDVLPYSYELDYLMYFCSPVFMISNLPLHDAAW